MAERAGRLTDLDVQLARELESLQSFTADKSLCRAYGEPLGAGVLRSRPEDFFVSEFGVQPSGQGEFLFLRVCKRQQNTRWVAKRLAENLNLPYRSVSYAGLKDRHAVTEQWFAVHMPGMPDPAPTDIQIEGAELLEMVRHSRKLRPGQLSYNAFKLTLRECRIADPDLLASRLEQIARNGVPNYFGRQRFGRNNSNLNLSEGVFELNKLPRERRSFVISALRSALFNGYLHSRVSEDSWSQALTGEITISDRSRGVAEEDSSVFLAERGPSGLLWGNGANYSGGIAGEQERDYFSAFPMVKRMLEDVGARASRRVLRTRVAELEWEVEADILQLAFSLGPGSYATGVLREALAAHEVVNAD